MYSLNYRRQFLEKDQNYSKSDFSVLFRRCTYFKIKFFSSSAFICRFYCFSRGGKSKNIIIGVKEKLGNP